MDNDSYEDFEQSSPDVLKERERVKEVFRKSIEDLLRKAHGPIFDGPSLQPLSDPTQRPGIKAYLAERSYLTGEPLPEGFHGRWEKLTPLDLKFLHGVGIDVDDRFEKN